MTTKINCPRCGSNNHKEIEESLDVGSEKVKASKHKCNDCDSRWYFEEEIIDYLKAISALIPRK